MRMTRIFGSILLVVLLGGFASAQPHRNGAAGVTDFDGQVFVFDGSKVSSLSLGSVANYGCVMDGLNRLLLVVRASGEVVKVDPKSVAVVGILASGLVGAFDIAIDHHGDHFINSDSTLWKVDPTGATSTILTGLPGAGGGTTIDIDTGELIIQSTSGKNVDPTLLVSRDGSSVTTLGIGANARFGIAQHIPSGDIFIGSCCGDFVQSENLYFLPAGSHLATVWLASPSPPVGVYSLKADRSSAATQQLLLGAFRPSLPSRGYGGLYTIDLATRAVSRLTTIRSSLYEVELLYRRNLFGIRTGAGTWDIGLAVPEDAGRGYWMIMGASGVRPGLVLPDGRKVNLVMDGLAFLGLTVGYGAYLKGTLGVLDAKGRATAQLDLTPFLPALNGLRLHFMAVTIDPLAPLGLKTITDPFVFKVEGR